MTGPTCDYAKLIRAAGTKDPVSAVLRSLTEGGWAWGALVTTTGKQVDSATRDSFDEVDATALAEAFRALPKPVSHTARVPGPGGREIIGFPVRAESRTTAVLLLAAEGDAEPELVRFAESAALLLRLQWRYQRRVLTASRMVRDSVTRLMFAGQSTSAFELAAEMGLFTPPTRPHVVSVCGLADWDSDDALDLFEAGLPKHIQQILAYCDDDECWMLLSAAQFQVLKPELAALVRRDPALKVLLTEQIPTSTLNHRWQHWATDIRGRTPGTIVDRSAVRGETPSDLVHKLQSANPQLVEAVIEYLRQRGRWETAADRLGVHRNTLRYRVRTAEKLLGVDLADPTASAELWLALRHEGLVSDRPAVSDWPPSPA